MAKVTGSANSKVDFFFLKDTKWAAEFSLLRTIVLSCGLTEELKWGCPCYTDGNRNVVLIHGFKEYCALLFFKGALLKDDQKKLIRQSENVQAARQLRFKSAAEVSRMKGVVKSYVLEAIDIEKSGRAAERKKTLDFKVPEEFGKRLEEMPALKTGFQKLTPGRQRAYLLYFSSARQPKTRISRIEKCIPSILQGKGLDDQRRPSGNS